MEADREVGKVIDQRKEHKAEEKSDGSAGGMHEGGKAKDKKTKATLKGQHGKAVQGKRQDSEVNLKQSPRVLLLLSVVLM